MQLPLMIEMEQQLKKKNRRRKNKKKDVGDKSGVSERNYTLPDANTSASEHHKKEDEDEEEEEDEDEEFMRFQQKMEEMHRQAVQNQQQKISFDGQWIDSLKQRL